MTDEKKDFKDHTHALGYDFERYVIGLFNKEFEVLNWIQDGTARTREEVDFSPDITVKHKATGECIGVECKFRSSLYNGAISWAKDYQVPKYDRYKEKTGFPVFIVIGVGGSPKKPDCMYCIPLWQARYQVLNTDTLKRYRRNAKRKFEWDRKSGALK